jgi:vacuolar-type H+-ATPase subunit H
VPSGLDEVVEHLRRVEERLDGLYNDAARYKRELLEFAEREAGRLKAELIEQVRALQTRLLAEETARAEEAAKEILSRGVWEADQVRNRAQGLREQAVELVVKAVLGG